jgi:hypothetical protein
MSQVRLATPVRLVQIAIALVAAIAAMSVMAAPSFAAKKSATCSGVLNCNTVIVVAPVEIDINASRILSDNEILTVETTVTNVLNNNLNCNQILNIGLTAGCKSAIITAVGNVTKSFNNINVLGIQVIKV